MKAVFQKFIHKKSSGFTLAEVLVTLIVIGVIASLTVPSLLYSVQKHTWVESMRKAYSSLSQVTNQIMQDNGGTLAGVFTNENDLMNKYALKMSFVKTCLAGQDSGACFYDGNSTWYKLDGSPGWANPTDNARAVGSDGVLYRFNLDHEDCSSDYFIINGQDSGCGYIMFDVNGFKGPNTTGRDIFWASLTSKGLFLTGSVGCFYSGWNSHCNPSSTDIRGGIACGQRVMQQGGMNY